MLAAGGPTDRTRRVLYVDDEVGLVELLTLGLGDLGYRVTGFTDPVAALSEFRSRPTDFDALVCDLAMPRLTGLELARRVLDTRPGLPVVLISGYVRDEDAAAARALGVLGFTSKGCSVQEIARSIHEALQAAPGPTTTRRPA